MPLVLRGWDYNTSTPKAPRSHYDHVSKKVVLNMDHCTFTYRTMRCACSLVAAARVRRLPVDVQLRRLLGLSALCPIHALHVAGLRIRCLGDSRAIPGVLQISTVPKPSMICGEELFCSCLCLLLRGRRHHHHQPATASEHHYRDMMKHNYGDSLSHAEWANGTVSHFQKKKRLEMTFLAVRQCAETSPSLS